jgi:transcriptional regulator NrdR family protein
MPSEFACTHRGCNAATSVRQTFKDKLRIERIRKCKNGHTFTTIEQAAEDRLTVLRHTKSGQRSDKPEDFDRAKLERSIRLAAAGRLDNVKISRITDEVMSDLRTARQNAGTPNAAIDTRDVGFAVLARLKEASPVAWFRYATVFLVDRGEVDSVQSLRKVFADGLGREVPLEKFDRPVEVLKRPNARRGATAKEDFSITKLWEGLFRATKGLTPHAHLEFGSIKASGGRVGLTPHQALVGTLVAGVLERVEGQRIVTAAQLSASCIDVLREMVPLGYIRYVTIAKRLETQREIIIECDAVAEAYETFWDDDHRDARLEGWESRRRSGIKISREVLHTHLPSGVGNSASSSLG